MKWPWKRSSDAYRFAAAPRREDLFSEQAIGLFTERLFGISDPDIVLKKIGKTRRDLAVLEYDDEIAAALATRFAAVAGTPWRLEPFETDAHTFLWAELAKVIDPLLRALWNAVPYGYAVVEVIYARRGGRIGIGAIHDKPMEWFRPERDGSLTWLTPDNPDGERVDTGTEGDAGPLKFLLARHNASWRNPYGEALLSRLYWPWFFRSNGWQFWARFLERFGAPLLVGSGPGNPEDLARTLAGAVQSGAIATSADTSVIAIAPGNAGTAFSEFGKAVDKRIQKLVLGQTLTTDIAGGGSYAAAKVQDEVRYDRLRGDIRMIAATVQRLVDALWQLNRFPGAPPTFVLEAGEGLSTDRADRDLKLAQAGAVFTEDYFVRAYDFEPGEVSVRAPAAGTLDNPAPAFCAPHDALAFAALPRSARAGQVAIDKLADDAIGQAQSPVEPAAIRAAVQQATDEEDLIERLGQLATDLPAPQFRDLLERALFAADLIGYAKAAPRG